MKIPFLFACCLAMACDARVTGIDYEIFPATVWQLADGSYRVKILEIDQDQIIMHDFDCDNLRHSEECQCTTHIPQINKTK